MNSQMQGVVTVVGRTMLSMIFLTSAVAEKIPNFSEFADYTASGGVPAAPLMLVGAIVFMIAGSLSVILGFRARVGASLLLIFLLLATYFFHDFWTLEDAEQGREQMIHFMKNTALMGAMLLIVANGPGPMSLDARRDKKAQDA